MNIFYSPFSLFRYTTSIKMHYKYFISIFNIYMYIYNLEIMIDYT